MANIEFSYKGEWYVLAFDEEGEKFEVPIADFSKTAFLTPEAAQQALKADEKEIEPTPKPQTNFERIKAMSIEELAADNVYFIPNNDEFHYTGLSGNYRSTAKEVVEDNIKWLESEVSE